VTDLAGIVSDEKALKGGDFVLGGAKKKKFDRNRQF